MRSRRFLSSLPLLSICAATAGAASAQGPGTGGAGGAATIIVPDSVAGRSAGTSVDRNGAAYTIDGGTLAGRNLFHSFSHFSLGSGDLARWVHSAGDPSMIANVINRVTGGQSSTIDGTIDSSAIPNAAFFFINPAGIIFGAGAQVNVPAAAHFSTAAELRFADGGTFSVATPSGSTFSMASPTSFGFVGGQGNIALDGAGQSFLPLLSPLSLTAANILVRDSSFAAGSLAAIAVGDEAGEVSFDNPQAASRGGVLGFDNSIIQMGGDAFLQGGSISLANQSAVVTFADLCRVDCAAGAMTVLADRLDLSGSGILALNQDASGKSVLVRAEEIVLSGGSQISSNSLGLGTSGFVDVRGSSILLAEGSTINTNGRGAGGAGEVRVTADKLSLATSSNISSDTFGEGAAGNIFVTAGELDLSDESYVSSDSLASGNAGQVAIDAGNLVLAANSYISSDSLASGNAGQVVIDARDLVLSGDSYISSDALANCVGAEGCTEGNAGSVVIAAARVHASGGALISSDTAGGGTGGAVLVSAGEVTLDSGAAIRTQAKAGSSGDGGAIGGIIGVLNVLNGASISSDTFGSGPAGGVFLQAGTVAVRGGSITSSTHSTGNGLGLTIEADEMLVDQGGEIASVAQPGSLGSAGVVLLNVKQLTVGSDASVSSSTFGPGAAGGVLVLGETMLVTDRGTISSESAACPDGSCVASGNAGVIGIQTSTLAIRNEASIISNTAGSGDAGIIQIETAQLALDGGSITSRALAGSTGNAGQIAITAEALTLRGHSAIASDTFSEGTAGDIAIKGGDVRISQGSKISSDSGLMCADLFCADGERRGGNAGSVSIEARRLILEGGGDGAFISSDTFGAGNAGNISLTLSESLSAQAGFVSSDTAGQGNAGSVTISAPDILVDFSDISSRSFAVGDAGLVTIAATRLSLVNGGKIGTTAFFAGQAGNVSITADSVSVSGGNEFGGPSSISSDAEIFAEAGNIEINAQSLAVSDGGFISSQTFGEGDAGTVSIKAKDVAIADAGQITTQSNAGSSGNAGILRIEADNLRVSSGGNISSDTLGSGDGGAVLVEAGKVLVEGPSFIRSRARPGSTGDAGLVQVTAETVTLREGGTFSSNTFGPGTAGTVSVEAGELRLEGGRITSAAAEGSSGASGDVLLLADQMTLVNGASVDTISQNSNPAGRVAVVAGALTLDGANTRISSANQSPAGGDAGSVAIEAGAARIANGAEISTSSVAGAAGDIDILLPGDALLILEGAAAPGVITTSSGPGTGGRITISNPRAIISNGGSILALGESGGANVQIQSRFFISSADRLNTVAVDGVFLLDSQIDDVSSGTSNRELSVLDASKVLRGQCPAARSSGQISQFTFRPVGPYAPPTFPQLDVRPPQPEPEQSSGLCL